MKVRDIAFKCLCGIMKKEEFASLVMRYRHDGLSNNDQALLTTIVYGTLRHQMYLRYQWSLYVDNPIDQEIAILMDMSVYQLLFMQKVPHYAVVNEAVQIAHDHKEGTYSRLVNAVLRKISLSGAVKVEESDEIRKLAIETSHPEWLIRMWIAHYGWEACEKICREDLQQAKVALRVNVMKTTAEELLKDPLFVQGPVADSLYYRGNIVRTDYFRNHDVIIQAVSSQQVVNTLDPQPDDLILDVCASPGTKSFQMAMARNDQGKIIACDIYPKRVELIDKGIKKYGLSSIETKCCDGRMLAYYFTRGTFDKVLVDAPCSGLGTLKHKPEIKYNLKPEDLDDIVKLQAEILAAAGEMVKPQGILVYSTCTLNKKENERQIAAFLADHPDFTLISERTIFPFDEHSDGFYIAKLQRSMIE